VEYREWRQLLGIERARHLRKNMPAPEARLWNALRELRPLGFHFRRQVEFGKRYYLDFCCHSAKLVVEVDGDTHCLGRAPERDARRDAFIQSEGYRVLRVTNLDVMDNIDGVITVILDALGAPPSPRSGD
jgi:very-short-patch-repair endonuclease